MKKIQMLVLGLTFSLLVLSCFALERIGVAQVVPESNFGCPDLPGCLSKMTCGSKGTANHCHITCEDTTVIVCSEW
jgi:hypothetical protein